MKWLSKLRQATQLADELLKYGPEFVEALKLLREVRQRNQRDADVGDLNDSIARLEALDRRKGS